MRTKKFLSILLAVIMCMGTFGIIGVFAEEEQEVSFGPGPKGWSNSSVVNIAEDVSAAGGVDSAVILWEAFLGSVNGLPSETDSFITLYNKDVTGAGTTANPYIHPWADVIWEAYRVQNNGDTNILDPIKIYDKRADATNTSGAYLEISPYADRTDVKLVITQVPKNERYCWVRVKLTVKVQGYTDAQSVNIWVQLRDPTELAKKLLKANEELAKTDRYSDKYLANLKLITREAEKDVNKKISQAELDAWVVAVQLAIDAKKPDGTSVGKKYKLTGWEWLDNLIPDLVCKAFWMLKDIFVPMFDFFGQIGKMVGYLLPLFSMIGGLFGL